MREASEVERLIDFVTGMPKAELHLHIEGSLEPEMMMRLAVRNAVSLPYADIEAVKAAYEFTQLQDFLDIYYQGMSVLQSEQDFYDLTWAYCQRAAQDRVLHTEIFFDPQAHVERGIAFETVVGGIDRALRDAEQQLHMSSRLIMCFLRHLDEQSALDTLALALPHKDKIRGVGLDSSELGHPPEKFERVFAQARAEGFACVAHAGEEGPPAYVWGALDRLQVQRVDHGNAALQDPALCQRLADEKMPLTVCPLSNLKLCVVDDMARHPVPEMLQRELKVTINSDDPAYFGGYVNDNFVALVQALELSLSDCVQMAENSFDAAFVSAERQRELHVSLSEYCRAHGV